MEEGLFPHKRSLNDPGGLEEERRLCYVGTTRAMSQLYLSYAEQRRMHGVDNYAQASRFLAEIPAELIEEVRPNIRVSRPVYRRSGTLQQSDTSGRRRKFGWASACAMASSAKASCLTMRAPGRMHGCR